MSAELKRWNCGQGVFQSTGSGALEPRAAWRDSLAELCAAVAGVVGKGAQIRYRAYPCADQVQEGSPRMVGLDVSGPLGEVYLGISVSSRGNPCGVEDRDLPRLSLGNLRSGSELEFWMANECDTLCLAACLLAALDQASFSADSSFAPSTRAR
jgi:hypothetical protein